MSPSHHSNRSEREVADTIAHHLSGRGTPVRRETAGGHEFVIRQREGSGTETELMWIACDRTVGESHVERLKQSAASVGASCVCVVTTDGGRLEATPGPGVSHVEASDLSSQSGDAAEPAQSDAGDSGTTASSRWDGVTTGPDETRPGDLWDGTTAESSERPPPRSPWEQSTLGDD